jgi:hypothetical protein
MILLFLIWSGENRHNHNNAVCESIPGPGKVYGLMTDRSFCL